MHEAGSTDGDEGSPVADEVVADDLEVEDVEAPSLEERLERSEAARAQLELLLEHEEQSARRILEAHGTAQGRVAELEGVLTGTEAVRARAETERDELQRRLTIELAAREQRHDELLSSSAAKVAALEQTLVQQTRAAGDDRSGYERRLAQDAGRITELTRQLADERSGSARRLAALQEEVKEASESVKPRTARKLAEMQAELAGERDARRELEDRVLKLTEAVQERERARAQESEAAAARIAVLEPALAEARTEWGRTRGELDALRERLGDAKAAGRQLQAEHDGAAARATALERARAESDGRIAGLELALEAVTAERDRLEATRRALEARGHARDEAERAWHAEREAEQHVARSQRQQLTRVERRMTEIAGGLGIALRRLDAPELMPAGDVAAAPATARASATAPAVSAPVTYPAAGASAEVDTETPAAGAGPRTLVSGFLRCAGRFASRPALEVAGETYDFAGLHTRAASIAATLRREAPDADPPLTAVFAHRSVTAFAGLLGALMRGHGYVPLNRTLPVARSRTMLDQAGCQAIVADAQSAEQLPELLGGAQQSVIVLLPEVQDVSGLREALPSHRIFGTGDLEPAHAWEPAAVDPSAIAYLLFTSGSTGRPKGVMVAHRNALHYIDVLVARYSIDEQDRFSQTHDLTFDNSVFDMFVAWERGACVCCPGQRTLMNPGRYLRDGRLTVWFSVPSVAMFMRRLGGLKPDSYPDLRWSLFAGEPLPVEVVRAWKQAAPASTVENLYGPTETTVDVTLYRWDTQTSPAECERGILPIGHPLPGIGVLMVDEELREVGPGEQGELLVSGPQVTLGYWRDPERTAAAYITPPGHDVLHYRTGDLVRRPAQDGAPIVFLGRRDEQVKVRGVRIELGEIESALRDASGVDSVAALGWPLTLVGAGAVEAFVGSTAVDVAAVRAALAERLPGHMVPRRVRALAQLPLNANGKVDRAALVKLLEAE